MKLSRQEPIISFVQNVSIRDFLGFDPVEIYENSNLSPRPVDIFSSDNFFSKLMSLRE